jgi:hypothetical protein
LREEYFDKIIDRFETLTGQSIKTILYLNNLCKMILCQNTTHTKEMPMEWQTLYYKPHFETKVKEQKVKIYILQVS